MKKILFVLLTFLIATPAFAQRGARDLMGLGMSAELSLYLTTNGVPMLNNNYLKFENAAGSGFISVLKVDASDDTILNADSGDSVKIQIDGDSNRIYTFDASSDTALTTTFGDGGTTATQAWTLGASTADADDDSTFNITGGGAVGTSGSRGAYAVLEGNEVAGGGDALISSGGSSGSEIELAIAGTVEATLANDQLTLSGAAFQVVPGATSFSIRNNADSADNLLVADAGTVTTAAGITASTGNITSTAGGFVASTSGQTLHLQEATAGTKCMGTATANGTTAVTVSTTCALTASRIFISRTSEIAAGVTEPGCWATNIVNATSFDLDCNDAAENSTFNWIIVQEAA